MAQMMVGGELTEAECERQGESGDKTVLAIRQAECPDRSGLKTIHIEDLKVRAGEIVGIAGVSGNGQVELMEILSGQRGLEQGHIEVNDNEFQATRKQEKRNKVRFLPEEPLFNACAPRMSVAENMAYRNFDEDEDGASLIWIRPAMMRRRALGLVDAFKVKTTSVDSPIEALSGGNVQRAVLARELTGQVDLLIISNPCFGLDFSAVADIRGRIMQARNSGTAVLLISEDLDEIMQLSDRVLVMSEGHIAFETPIEQANVEQIGQYMAGHA
jgi:simple sugar transport system ATP-binding protein